MGMRFIHLGCALAVLLASAPLAMSQSAEQTQMAQRVAVALKESGQLSGYRVGVKFQDGVAWLVGTVTDQEQHDAAVAIAGQVQGIDRVISKLEVIGSANQSPTRNAVETSPSLLYDSLQESLKSIEQPNGVAPASAEMSAPQLQGPRPMGQPMARSARPMPMSPQQAQAVRMAGAQQNRPMPVGYNAGMGGPMAPMGQMPQGYVPNGGGAQASFDNAHLPNYAWPSYAAHNNYAAVTYPKQYSPTAWPYIGPFYPYPQVPLGWRKVTLEWDDGWWMLDFSHKDCQ